MMLTPTELKAIRDRCEKATPGPWTQEAVRSFFDQALPFDRYEAEYELAANAPVDIPRLLDEVERLRKALEWYADKSNYIVRIEYDEKMTPIKSFNPISETGHRAREALKELSSDDINP